MANLNKLFISGFQDPITIKARLAAQPFMRNPRLALRKRLNVILKWAI